MGVIEVDSEQGIFMHFKMNQGIVLIVLCDSQTSKWQIIQFMDTLEAKLVSQFGYARLNFEKTIAYESELRDLIKFYNLPENRDKA